MKILLRLLCLSMFINIAVAAPVNKEAQATYKDIKETLGRVPAFLKDFPEDAITGAWTDMKSVQLNPKTNLNGKYKELIGLAVSAQVPCRYCTYFHRSAAKLNQASAQEMKEAVAMASSVRRWSTILHGTQVSMDQFKSEADQIIKFAQNKQGREAMEDQPQAAPKEITTAQEAYEDIKLHMGIVPAFLQNYPQTGIVGAWNEMKAVELNPNTAIPGKYKDLIGLAVASQIPCPYCIYFHTQSALSQGATKEEIQEAVAMAGITRHWSTVLNGQYTDEKKFEKEADQIMKYVKAKAEKSVTKN